MRKSRVIAVVVASLVSSASIALAQAPAQAPQAIRHDGRGGMWGGRGHGGALRGITLSDAEKAKLKAVHEKYGAQSKSLRESLKPAMDEARAARQKGDTAAVKAVWARNKAGRDKMKALRDGEQAEIRASLTSEHQQAFDANVAKLKDRRAEAGKDRKEKRKDRRAGTNG